jgi:DNA replication protein DnaD
MSRQLEEQLLVIILAVDETVSAQNPSFKYIDAVLKEWAEKGLTTPEALTAEKQRQEKAKVPSAGAGRKSGTAVNQKFKPEGRDLSFLEK